MKRLASLIAVAAMLALPASTFAASESLNVNATTSITGGVPASVSYGSNDAGTTAVASAFTVTFTTNDPLGLTLSVGGSDLVSGANTITATNRATFIDSVVLPSKDFAVGAGSSIITPRVSIPAAAVPGAYTGTFTISVAGK